MTRVTWRGHTFDQRTAAQLQAAATLIPFPITPSQGSYSHGVHASGGTHDGGGAVDISMAGHTDTQGHIIETMLRRVGLAAWLREPIPGVWPRHVHGISIGCPDLSPAAAAQVQDYHHGNDGLAHHGPDHGDRRYVTTTWESYQSAQHQPVSTHPTITTQRPQETFLMALTDAQQTWLLNRLQKATPGPENARDAVHATRLLDDADGTYIVQILTRIEQRLTALEQRP